VRPESSPGAESQRHDQIVGLDCRGVRAGEVEFSVDLVNELDGQAAREPLFGSPGGGVDATVGRVVVGGCGSFDQDQVYFRNIRARTRLHLA
jgi:hypothetical protein